MQLSYENFEFFGENVDLVNQVLDGFRIKKMEETEEMMKQQSVQPDLRVVK
jgi:hypothetical protein